MYFLFILIAGIHNLPISCGNKVTVNCIINNCLLTEVYIFVFKSTLLSIIFVNFSYTFIVSPYINGVLHINYTLNCEYTLDVVYTILKRVCSILHFCTVIVYFDQVLGSLAWIPCMTYFTSQHTHTHTYTHTHTFMYTHRHTCMYTHRHTYMRACTHISR